jgi:hypothetical protein
MDEGMSKDESKSGALYRFCEKVTTSEERAVISDLQTADN